MDETLAQKSSYYRQQMDISPATTIIKSIKIGFHIYVEYDARGKEINGQTDGI